MFPEPPPQLEWLKPWERLEASEDAFVSELQKEMPPRHVLHGLSVINIARRIDSDDVLFVTSDPTKPLAVVHLTYHAEYDPQWPYTTLYESWRDWIERCLPPEHEEYEARVIGKGRDA
jgi:hypothetical protein